MKKWMSGMFVLAALAAHPAAAIDPDCTADIFTNGVVDAVDVLVVSGSIGPCDPIFCPGDVNGNGVVGSLDLARVLANLGSCPLIGDVDQDGLVCDKDVRSVCESDPALQCPPLYDGSTCDNLFTYCPDIDGNGLVDQSDAFIVLASFSFDPDDDADPAADINGDGVVDIVDFGIVDDNLGKNCRMDVDFNLVIEVIDGAIIGTQPTAAVCGC